jgi:hypothetical protein
VKSLPGGRALVADLRKGVPMTEINRYFDRVGLSRWDRWITRLTFRLMLLRRAYTVEAMQQLIAGIGFAKTRIDIIDIGMEVWLEK